MYEGEFLIQSVFKVFKNRPGCAVSVVLVAGMIILSVMLAQAKTPDDRVFPVAGLVVIVLVGLGQVVQAIWRHKRIENYPAPVSPDQAEALAQVFPTEESKLPSQQPVSQLPIEQPVVAEQAQATVSTSNLNLLADGFHYLTGGPARIWHRTVAYGLVRGSIEAIIYSLVLQGLFYAFVFVLGGCLFGFALILMPVTGPDIDPFEDLMLTIPMVVLLLLLAGMVIPMFLSALAAAGLALGAFVKASENKIKALIALIISAGLLLWYALGAILSIGLALE